MTPIKNILVIAGSKAIADEMAKNFTGMSVQTLFPGAVKFPRHFEAIIVTWKEEKDFKEANGLKSKYPDVPIAVCVGPSEKPDPLNEIIHCHRRCQRLHHERA